MKEYEYLASEYADQDNVDAWIVGENCYIAGFLKAREMAIVELRTQGVFFSEIEGLGEKEV